MINIKHKNFHYLWAASNRWNWNTWRVDEIFYMNLSDKYCINIWLEDYRWSFAVYRYHRENLWGNPDYDKLIVSKNHMNLPDAQKASIDYIKKHCDKESKFGKELNKRLKG